MTYTDDIHTCICCYMTYTDDKHTCCYMTYTVDTPVMWLYTLHRTYRNCLLLQIDIRL